MAQLIYNHSIIKEHPFYEVCPSTLKDVSNDDYAGANHFTKDVPCIALDKYEELQSGQNDCTMDAVVGVAEYNNNRINRSSLALVELRLDYKNPCNLDFANMARKVQHSRDLLAGAILHNKDYFVFTERVAAQAIHVFRRFLPLHPVLKNAKPISVLGYEREIKDIEDYPYMPIFSKEEILESLNPDDSEKLFFQLDYWLSKVDDYSVKYELNEAEHILEVLNESFVTLPSYDDDFVEEYMDIYKEDVLNRLRTLKR